MFAADRYMYARAGHSTLLTAIYDHNVTHCLEYRRHMRSHTAGHFAVFYQLTDMINVPPSYVTLNDTKLLKEVSGRQGDIWFVIENGLLWSPYGIGQTIILLPSGFFVFLPSYFFPRLTQRSQSRCLPYFYTVFRKKSPFVFCYNF